ncbi:MAG: hypothetical protein M3262_04525, partial [Actinomycetota bacterium]|nr:hypothetical protein [Actinomycetota bacterium]
MSERTWGFESPLAHNSGAASLRALRRTFSGEAGFIYVVGGCSWSADPTGPHRRFAVEGLPVRGVVPVGLPVVPLVCLVAGEACP